MNSRFRLGLVCLLLLSVSACASAVTSAGGSTRPESTPDASAVKLSAMGAQARQMAQKEAPDIVLRQVDTDLHTTDFQFVDSALTKVITVLVPEPDAPVDRWSTALNTISPLLTNAQPAVDLRSLRVGPNRVAQAMTAHWPGCGVRAMTLYRENDRLVWTGFCNTPEGVASGSLDNQTGVFQPSDAPPAPAPPTALPGP